MLHCYKVTMLQIASWSDIVTKWHRDIKHLPRIQETWRR